MARRYTQATTMFVSGVLLSAFLVVAQEAGGAKTIPYRVLSRDATGSEKVVYNIEVNLVDGRLPRKDELAAISRLERGRDMSVERVFVQFFLPGMDLKSSCFAVAHHTPEPQDVQVFPERAPRAITEILNNGKPLANATKYSSLTAVVEKLGGYSVEEGTLVVHKSDGVPHVEVSPRFVTGDLPEVVEKELRRAAVSVILSVFGHTDFDSIRVSVSRCYIDKSRKLSFDRKNPRVLTVGRTDTERVIKKLTGEELHKLFGANTEAGFDPDIPTQTFLRCIFDDRGHPTLGRVYTELSALPKPPEFRQWTDVTGVYKTEAEFVGLAAGKVKLRKRDGTIAEVPREKLSLEDQEWVAGRKSVNTSN